MNTTTGVWDDEADRHMAVIDAQEQVLRDVCASHEVAHTAWLLARPGRELIEGQVRFLNELKTALLTRLQAKQRAAQPK